MKRLFDNAWYDRFIEGAARAVWVQAWADHQEAKGKALRGELMHQAPATPLAAYVWAGRMVGHVEVMNKVSIYVLERRAEAAEHGEVVPEDFGHYLAMETLGHGVSWFDNHAPFDIKFPHLEFDYYS